MFSLDGVDERAMATSGVRPILGLRPRSVTTFLISKGTLQASAGPMRRVGAETVTEGRNRAATEMNGQIHHTDPKHPLQFCAAGFRDCWTDLSLPTVSMYIIESLHPDGWREQGSARVEYWACMEAQARCCSDGRNYRIIESRTHRIVALIDTSSCRLNLSRAADLPLRPEPSGLPG